MAKNTETRLKYRKHLRRQAESGLSVRKYCLAHNPKSHKSLYYRKPLSSKPSQELKPFFSKVISNDSMGKDLSKPDFIVKDKALIDPKWLSEFLNHLWKNR